MIILDGNALMHHSFHIGDDPEAVTTALGNEMNTAVYGFNRFMERYALPLLESHSPIDMVVAWDGGREYRSRIFPEYKMTTSRLNKDPEERLEQGKMVRMMQQFFAAIGATQAHVKGVEADDLIAYLCEKIREPINIYTVDADLLQLQGQYDNVSVLLKCEYYEGDEHDGVPLKYISLAKSMIGDKSDNYKGVPGFGIGKWKDLVNAYGYDGIEELEECVKKNDYTLIKEVLDEEDNKALRLLYENHADWRLSYRLAVLRPELCWKPRAKEMVNIDWYKRVPSVPRLTDVLSRGGCLDLLEHEDIQKYLPEMWDLSNEEVDDDLYEEFAAECKRSPVVAFDYETSPSDMAMATDPKGESYVDVKEAQITGVSFTFGENLHLTMYIPVDHKDADNIRVEVVGKLLKIAQENSKLVAQGAFFELAVTKTNLDFWLDGLYDTRIAQSYVDENEEDGLKSMSSRILNYKQASYSETVADPVTGEPRQMRELTVPEVLQYGCDDAIVTAHIFVLYRIIMMLEETFEFFEEYESYSNHSLVDAYLKGAEIDWDALKVQHQKDLNNIEENYNRLRELLQENCTSPNEKAAKAFVDSDVKFIKGKAKKDFLASLGEGHSFTEEQVNEGIAKAKADAYNRALRDAIEGSVYAPYEVTYEEAEFKPTALQLTALTTSLGFDVPLEVVSQKGMREWLVEVTQPDMEAKKDTRQELTKLQSLFCELLAEAVPQIPKRVGEEYDKFIRFCQANSQAEGKETATGDELNTGSPKQMQQLFYCKLGLPVRLTSLPQKGSARDTLKCEGSAQTNELAAQTAMAEDTMEGDWKREALNCVLAIKESKTRCSLYHDTYPLWKHPSDGRIHPQIKNCGTVTRRPSGTKPNILQVSKHQQDGVMRSIYLPLSEDELIVSIDFKQQELMIMGSESQDANLISCYSGNNQRDVHSLTAAGILKTNYEKYLEAYEDEDHPDHKEYVTVRKRPAKQTNFLFAYLGEAFTLSQRLIIPQEEAQAMMDAAYATYPRVQPWQDEVIKFAKTHGYSVTAYGNRRHANKDMFSSNNSTRRRIERQLVNAEIQGCAADILKVVLTNCWKTNIWRDTGSTLIGPVYDEITSSVPVSTIVEYINRMVDIMEITPPGHPLRMQADVSIGKNWRDQIEIGVRPSEETILNAVERARS